MSNRPIIQDRFNYELKMLENFVEKDIQQDKDNFLKRVSQELENGLNAIKEYPKSVTILGSSKMTENDKWIKDVNLLSKKIVTDLGYAVVTGGGPGIMESANMGAKDAGGNSIGITIDLPREQKTNTHVTKQIACNYFFTRKTLLVFSSEALVFFPGGYGTLDELFGILVLLQNRKIPQIPIILFGREYWEETEKFIQNTLYKKYNYIDERDAFLFNVTDSIDEVVDIIRKSPVRRWWKDYEMSDK